MLIYYINYCKYIMLVELYILLYIFLFLYINKTLLKLFCVNNLSPDCYDNSSIILTLVILFYIELIIIFIYILFTYLLNR